MVVLFACRSRRNFPFKSRRSILMPILESFSLGCFLAMISRHILYVFVYFVALHSRRNFKFLSWRSLLLPILVSFSLGCFLVRVSRHIYGCIYISLLVVLVVISLKCSSSTDCFAHPRKLGLLGAWSVPAVSE